MAMLFTNNATARLKIAIPAASTSIQLQDGEGARFPSPADGDFFLLTLHDQRTDQIEVTRCTARAGDILTVERGQEGTPPQDFLPGATASNRITAGTLAFFQQLVTDAGGYAKVEADERFVHRAGDDMTGGLELPAPTIGAHAANKDYVDTGLAGKSNTDHTHDFAAVIGLQPALDGKSPVGHTHPKTDVIGLVADLSALNSAVTTLDAEKTDEAPNDGKQYARKGLGWAEVALPADGVEEAPADTQLYVRRDNTWTQLPPTSNLVPEAPNDTNPYARRALGWVIVDKALVGLSNVTNTSDANKPVSTAQQTALNLKLDKTGGTLSGNLAFSDALEGVVLSHGGKLVDQNTLGPGGLGRTLLYSNNSNFVVMSEDGTNPYFDVAPAGAFRNGWRMWDEQNFTPSSYLPLTGGVLSGQLNINGGGMAAFGTVSSTNGALQAQTGIITQSGALTVFNGTSNHSFSTSGTPGAINVSPSSLRHSIQFAGTNSYQFDQSFFIPSSTGVPTLGTSSFRWSTIFTTVPVNVSSDRKLKTNIRQLTDAEMAFARELRGLWAIYQLKASIEEKGESAARLHSGMIVQDIEDLAARHGVDPTRYGFFCRDENEVVKCRETEHEIKNADGTPMLDPEAIVYLVDEGGERLTDDDGAFRIDFDNSPTLKSVVREYHNEKTGEFTLSLRYVELLSFMAAADGQDIARLEDQQASFASRLAALESRA